MIITRRLALALTPMLALAARAFAQPAPGIAVRLRGTIVSIGDGGLDLTLRDGGNVQVLIPASVRVTYTVAAKLEDIKPGSYIGTAAIPQPDGTQRALEIHVFPPELRGRGEGFRPYDLAGGASTMTNGTVGSLVGTSGRVATVRYGDQEQKVVIPDNTPVVTFAPADARALVPGAKVVISGTRVEGKVTAVSINVGKDGLTPPM